MKTIFMSLLKDESGTAVTEWVVAASIMAVAGIAAFGTIGGAVKNILASINAPIVSLDAAIP
jgi:Flp pilus assembly pilin Flp